jgi:hypothetical protein
MTLAQFSSKEIISGAKQDSPTFVINVTSLGTSCVEARHTFKDLGLGCLSAHIAGSPGFCRSQTIWAHPLKVAPLTSDRAA